MLPSKDMIDFVDDINKLFSRTASNDGDSSYTYTSPFQTGNRSSSSADSISPESYFDFSRPDITPDSRRYFDFRPFEPSRTRDMNNIYDRAFDNCSLDPQNSNSLIDTPFSSLHTTNVEVRHPRPIVGRRILGSKAIGKNERDVLQIDNLRNYELFPSDNKGYEFMPIINKVNDYTRANQSSAQQNFFSPKTYTQRLTNFNQPLTPVSTSSSSRGDFDTKMCSFCRKNGETAMVYMTHCVKEKIGNRHIVTCPILRSHECKTCGASGDNAHTLTYCPVLRSGNQGKPLQSTTIKLKNTRIKSNGKRRY